MRNELFFNSTQDGALKHLEDDLIEKIKNQIENTYGEYIGEITEEPNYIQEYFNQVYVARDFDDILENFEQISSESGSEDIYDYISLNILKIFKESVGIKIDIEREMFSFIDIYNIYVIFILSLKETVKLSTKGFYTLNGNPHINISIDSIVNYILSDEFSSNDDFIKNAAFITDNELIKNIKHMIDDSLISINHNIFIDFIHKFIIETEF